MSITAAQDRHITNKLPPTLATEFRTLISANGGGVSQSAVSLPLERHLIGTLGHTDAVELISLLNSVGRGVSKGASTRLLESFGDAFGREMRRELETTLLAIS